MATEQWYTPTNPHTAISVTTDFHNNGRIMGGQLIPSGYIFSAWELNLPSGTPGVPTSPFSIDLYAITTLDNSVYSVGNSGVAPQGQQYLCSFTLYPNANSGQVLHQIDVPLSPFRFIPLLQNKAGVTIPATSGTLKVSFYNRQIV